MLITFLVYHYNIKQAYKRFYITYKITWITFMNYLNVPFLLLSGESPQHLKVRENLSTPEGGDGKG